MSAAAALARAEAAGVRFQPLLGGAVRMEAAAAPPPEMIADLRRWREDIEHLVAVRSGLAARQPEPRAVDWQSLPYGRERGEAAAAARRTSGACSCCAGRRWWCGEGAQAAPRCMACHPPPPGLAFREKTT